MRFQHTVTVGLDSQDWKVEVEANYTPGAPETGPSYACGGTPADPDEVEVRRVIRVDGIKSIRFASSFIAELTLAIEADDGLMEALAQRGAEEYAADCEGAEMARAAEREED